MNEYDGQEDEMEVEELSEDAVTVLQYLDEQPTTAFNLAFELSGESVQRDWRKEDVMEVADELVEEYGLLETRYSGSNLRGHDAIYSLTEEGEEWLDEYDA